MLHNPTPPTWNPRRYVGGVISIHGRHKRVTVQRSLLAGDVYAYARLVADEYDDIACQCAKLAENRESEVHSHVARDIRTWLENRNDSAVASLKYGEGDPFLASRLWLGVDVVTRAAVGRYAEELIRESEALRNHFDLPSARVQFLLRADGTEPALWVAEKLSDVAGCAAPELPVCVVDARELLILAAAWDW